MHDTQADPARGLLHAGHMSHWLSEVLGVSERNKRHWPTLSSRLKQTQCWWLVEVVLSSHALSSSWSGEWNSLFSDFQCGWRLIFLHRVIVFCPLLSAPSSTPQNIHVIQRDPGLILEWEGVAPDVLKENVLGYRLEWIQDNVTQVR